MSIDAILLDDNPWVCAEWQTKGQQHAKSILALGDMAALDSILPTLTRTTPLFLDVELGNGVSGVEIAHHLKALGFNNIFLTTAHAPGAFSDLPFIKGVLGKDPPAWLFTSIKMSEKLSQAARADLLVAMSKEQKAAFEQRMREYEEALYGMDGSAWLDGIGIYYPDDVLDAWERALYESCSEAEIRQRIQSAWRESLENSKKGP